MASSAASSSSDSERMEETLICQGAEARLFATTYSDRSAIVKERFKKEYRHPVLDDKITKERLVGEARCIARCRRAGVDAPLLYFVDTIKARIYMERIHGVTVKAWLMTEPSLQEWTVVAGAVGGAIARIHANNMVHGDLTTSNIMLRGYPHVTTPSTHEEEDTEGLAMVVQAEVIPSSRDDDRAEAAAAGAAGAADVDVDSGGGDGAGTDILGDVNADSTAADEVIDIDGDGDGGAMTTDGAGAAPGGAGAASSLSSSSSSAAVDPSSWIFLALPKGYQQTHDACADDVHLQEAATTVPIVSPHQQPAVAASAGGGVDEAAGAASSSSSSSSSSSFKLPPQQFPPSACASRPPQSSCPAGTVAVRIALIDFGLSSTNVNVEERGVDLYVLERALLSTHPYIAAPFFAAVLDSYFNSLPNPKDAAAMKTKFEAVRMRGRKRLAFG